MRQTKQWWMHGACVNLEGEQRVGMMHRKVLYLVILAWPLVVGVSTVAAQVEQEPTRPGRVPIGLGTIRVSIRNATGSPLSTQALVRLTQRVGTLNIVETTKDLAIAEFRNLPVGDYIIEVTAAGYEPAIEEATLFSPSNVSQVYILLRPESAPRTAMAAGPPVLTPKLQKELQEAVQALDQNDLKEAEKRLERAEKSAPGHPEVQYLVGVLLMKKNDLAGARQRFEKAVSLYPQHAAALGALGRVLLLEGNLAGAAGAYERALVANNRSQENHAMLALVLFQQQNLEKARYHAEQAIEIANGQLPETRLLLSQILIAQGERKKAADVLKKFLDDYPAHADAQAARRALAELQSDSPAIPSVVEPQRGDVRPEPASTSAAGHKVTPAGARVLSLESLTPEIAPGAEVSAVREWAPKDVDEVAPAVFSDVACPQDTVIKRAGERVVNLINNLGDVNAAERIAHTMVDLRGRLGRTDTAEFEYMFSYRRPRPGVLWVEELRDGSRGNRLVGGVGTSGFAAMALIFHPYYAGDFEMKCEGQGSWKGEPVWYIYFRQRDDLRPRMRSYTTSQGSAGLRFKGRAWIAANSFQIVRIETDLISPPRELRFESEHMVIEYGPVTFKERKQSFWLPVSVDIYAHERGRRWHRNHTLSNYIHFAVDTRYKITAPEVPEETVKPPQEKPPTAR